MIITQGDVFDTKANYIGHGVNCQGMMGAGIAKTVKEKYPKNYFLYRSACESGRLQPGNFTVCVERGKAIVNFATQKNPGPDATYENVFNSFAAFSRQASSLHRLEAFGNVIAIPKIGAGIGGLEWPIVELIIDTVEEIYPEIMYEVWDYGR